eukprot:COSAG01_NODE_38292_length_491_cov_1.512755_1_plen_59_part_00
MVARRGEAQVFTQSIVHAGWHRDDIGTPRKGMHCSWVAEGVSIGGMVRHPLRPFRLPF